MRFNSIKSHSKETIFDSFEFDNQLCQAVSKEIISKMNSDHLRGIFFIPDLPVEEMHPRVLENIFELKEG